jgi:heat shock transcription factor, other eukaryote
LIRWSDDGNSFVVLDEDEFAKTLIPELFKHNNYASFVRQLNMYGFHKKVGLSDNSMRASERKNKSPSEYSNPYFRRGHPDLLWLIQKPKNASGKKGKKDNDLGDDDADDFIDEPGLLQPPSRQRPPQLKQLGDGDSTLSQEQLQSIHQELSQIRSQQVAISKMMGQLKREQEQLYGQAATYQEQHNRHENSINAILTFLATIYNRSIQGHEGSQNIQNLFSAAIPHESQGTVVDVGDYNFDSLNGADGSQPKPFKKPPLLLTDGQSGRAPTMSPSSGSSPFPLRQTRRGSQSMRNVTSPLTGNVEELFDSAGNTPVAQPQSARSNSAQTDFMSIIHNANARNSNAGTPAADFSSVLNNLENAGGQSPLTNSQRADVLRMMNNSSRQGGDNALINSTPPPGPSNFNRQLARTNADLERLAKLQAEQDKSVQNLTNLLQPLSPTGSIPGIHDGASLPPPPLDIDDFLNHNEYFNDFPSDGASNYDFSGAGDVNGGTTQQGINFDYNNDDDELFGDLPPTSAETQDQNGGFGLDGADDDASELKGRVESLTSSEATTPDNVQQEGDRAQGVRTSPRNTRKGRKLSSVEDEAPSIKRRRS